MLLNGCSVRHCVVNTGGLHRLFGGWGEGPFHPKNVHIGPTWIHCLCSFFHVGKPLFPSNAILFENLENTTANKKTGADPGIFTGDAGPSVCLSRSSKRDWHGKFIDLLLKVRRGKKHWRRFDCGSSTSLFLQ